MTNHNKTEENNIERVQITNLANLEREIQRLKEKTKTLASEWESNNTSLKENLGEVLLRSVFGKLKLSEQMGNILSKFLFSQPIIMETLLKFRVRIIEKIQQIFRKR
jgi:hypothetical protein